MNFKNRTQVTSVKGPKKTVSTNLDLDATKDPYFSAATKLLEKRKEMFDIQSALSAKRKEFNKRLDEIKEKENGINKKKEDLTDNIIDLDNFIRENEMRREKAIQKKKMEERMCEQFDEMIQLREKEIEELEKNLAQKRNLLESKYSRFYKYLHDVVVLVRGQDNPDEVENLMKRYNRLKKENIKSNQEINQLKIILSNAQKDLFKYKDQKSAEIMNYTRDIAKLKRMVESERGETNAARKQLDDSQKGISKNKVVQGQVEMACKNLYTRVKSVSKIQRNKYIDDNKGLEKILDDILKYVEDYKIIADKIKQKQFENENKSNQI